MLQNFPGCASIPILRGRKPRTLTLSDLLVIGCSDPFLGSPARFSMPDNKCESVMSRPWETFTRCERLRRKLARTRYLYGSPEKDGKRTQRARSAPSKHAFVKFFDIYGECL